MAESKLTSQPRYCQQFRSYIKKMQVLLFAILCLQTASTSLAADQTTATATSSESGVESHSADRAVVLLGEIPQITMMDNETTLPEYQKIAREAFPNDLIIDMLSDHAIATRLKDLPTTVTQIPQLKVLVLIGRSDVAINTSFTVVQSALTGKLQSYVGSGRQVFILPSDPQLPISMIGSLRIAASAAGAMYVTLAGAEPLAEAFKEISRAGASDTAVLQAVTEPIQTPQTLTPPASMTTVTELQSLEPITIPQEMQRAVPGRSTPVSGVAEVARIAGFKDEDLEAFQTTGTTALDQHTTTQAPESISADGKLVKRGAEARETINMKPLPAVKAYRPAAPVRRKDIHKKSPDLAR